MEEKSMSSYEQIKLIDSFGPIKEIIKNDNLLSNILSSNYDRHMICFIFDKVNKGLEKGEITSEDLSLLRSGFLTKQILNLPSEVQKKGRNLYPFEIGDKLNYMSLIKDTETLNACYTNDTLLKQITETPNNENKYWITSGTFLNLPTETQVKVSRKFLELGNIELASELMEIVESKLENKRHREANIEHTSTRKM